MSAGANLLLRPGSMNVQTIAPDEFGVVAGWLQDPANYRWLEPVERDA
jgi:hypothetical protein